jgi:hypothetical protein
MFEQIRAGSGEEHLHRVFLPAQNGRQVAAGGAAEQGLRVMFRVSFEETAQLFFGARGPNGQILRGDPPLRPGRHDAPPGE